jgi:hypothetical protein
MPHEITTLLFIAVAFAITAFALKAPIGYDPKCNECSARRREAVRQQEELNHTFAHEHHLVVGECDHQGCTYKKRRDE